MLPGKLGPIIPGEPIFGKRNESDMLGMIIVEKMFNFVGLDFQFEKWRVIVVFI